MSRREVDLGNPPDIVAVAGPTATGKSSLAMELARRLGGELVNADALQMYEGLDIGTAKPSPADRAEIPHHALDIWRIDEVASVARFQEHARSVIRDIMSRGRRAIVVGGSPLYLRAACDELAIPPHDPRIRSRLAQDAERDGGAAMHARLAAVDPQAAVQIDPRNTRRVVRALEVVELTGRFSARMPERQSWLPTVWIGLDLPRAELDERIRVRAEGMWAGGLLEETRDLLAKGLSRAPTAGKALGYAQAIAVLAGEITATEGVEQTIAATRRLARRQSRTFHHDPRIHWSGPGSALPEAVALVERTRPPAAT